MHQGDPISPYLFILASEAISRGLNTLQNSCKQSVFFCKGGLPIIPHLAYADDIIVFCNGSVTSLKMYMELFMMYLQLTWQIINPHKSCFIAGRSISDYTGIKRAITKFQEGQ